MQFIHVLALQDDVLQVIFHFPEIAADGEWKSRKISKALQIRSSTEFGGGPRIPSRVRQVGQFQVFEH